MTGGGAVPDTAAVAAPEAMERGERAHRVVPVGPEEAAISTCMTCGTRQTSDGSPSRRTSSAVSRSMVRAILWTGMEDIRTVEPTERLPGKACESSYLLSWGCFVLMLLGSLGLSPYLRQKLVERLKLEDAVLQ